MIPGTCNSAPVITPLGVLITMINTQDFRSGIMSTMVEQTRLQPTNLCMKKSIHHNTMNNK